MKNNVTIKYICETKEKDKKTKKTEEILCYLGLNKFGDVWFNIDEIEKSHIKIRIASLLELKNKEYDSTKIDVVYFIKTKKILKWKFPIKSKVLKLKIGEWVNISDENIDKAKSLFIKTINYNAK